jgi:hypothetical protein
METPTTLQLCGSPKDIGNHLHLQYQPNHIHTSHLRAVVNATQQYGGYIEYPYTCNPLKSAPVLEYINFHII